VGKLGWVDERLKSFFESGTIQASVHTHVCVTRKDVGGSTKRKRFMRERVWVCVRECVRACVCVCVFAPLSSLAFAVFCTQLHLFAHATLFPETKAQHYYSSPLSLVSV